MQTRVNSQHEATSLQADFRGETQVKLPDHCSWPTVQSYGKFIDRRLLVSADWTFEF